LAARKKATKQKPVELDPVSARLEFLIGLSLLPPDATESEKVAVARRVGLDAAFVGRIFKKSDAAAKQAHHRAGKA
jgi:hypothetical protein